MEKFVEMVASELVKEPKDVFVGTRGTLDLVTREEISELRKYIPHIQLVLEKVRMYDVSDATVHYYLIRRLGEKKMEIEEANRELEESFEKLSNVREALVNSFLLPIRPLVHHSGNINEISKGISPEIMSRLLIESVENPEEVKEMLGLSGVSDEELDAYLRLLQLS